MSYKVRFFTRGDIPALIEMAGNAYSYEHPIVDISRIEFACGLHPEFTGFRRAWEHTVGIFTENDRVVASVWNEGTYEDNAMFLFDSKERAEDEELLLMMFKFAKTYAASFNKEERTMNSCISIPEWNKTMKRVAEAHGFIKGDWEDYIYVLPFNNEHFEVKLPQGYRIVDGNETPDFYLSNVHRLSFGYDREENACEHGEAAFHELRTMKYYDKELDLCVLDEDDTPVAIAIAWYDKRMNYCELEPLAVTWWVRRQGVATAILHELANRIMDKYPECKGMTGGDQSFYKRIGYKRVDESLATDYHWNVKVYESWDEKSFDVRYTQEVE